MLATHFLMLATLIVHAGGVKIHHEHHEPFADQDLTSDSHAHCVIFTTSPIWTINMTVLTQWHNQMGWAQSDGMFHHLHNQMGWAHGTWLMQRAVFDGTSLMQRAGEVRVSRSRSPIIRQRVPYRLMETSWGGRRGGWMGVW